MTGLDWGEIHEVTPGDSDAYYVRLARDGQGGILAVWSDRRDGNFDLYARDDSMASRGHLSRD